MIKYLVEEKGADFNVKDKLGNSGFLVACKAGKLDTVKYLIDLGVNKF